MWQMIIVIVDANWNVSASLKQPVKNEKRFRGHIFGCLYAKFEADGILRSYTQKFW